MSYRELLKEFGNHKIRFHKSGEKDYDVEMTLTRLFLHIKQYISDEIKTDGRDGSIFGKLIDKEDVPSQK